VEDRSQAGDRDQLRTMHRSESAEYTLRISQAGETRQSQMSARIMRETRVTEANPENRTTQESQVGRPGRTMEDFMAMIISRMDNMERRLPRPPRDDQNE